MSRTPRLPIYWRLWAPAAITGAIGTAVAFWFEESIQYIEEILALILITLMAGVIFLLNIFIFQSRMPRREDYKNSKDTGKK